MSPDPVSKKLLAITHEIFSICDISAAFQKVWDEEIILKLQCNGIPGNLSNLQTEFLKNKKNKVILNGQYSSWAKINAGIPQGSLLLLINISDLSDN